MVLREDKMGQTFLVPVDLKEFIPKDHICFYVSDIVDKLDFRKLDKKYRYSAGKPAYSRRMLMRIIMMASIDGVFSSRKIMKLTNENFVYTYLSGKESPDFRTIGTFKYRWDGLGRVYVSSSCCANVETDTIGLDDELIVENANGKKVKCAYNGPSGGGYTIQGPDLELTPILSVGTNELTFYIHDVYGVGMGCGQLYISQTYLQEGGEHILITKGYGRKITTYGVETDNIGTFSYKWNGIGKVYISSSYCADPTTDKYF
jgi:hypothetical protein